MAPTFTHLLILLYFMSLLGVGQVKNRKHEKKHEAKHKNRGWWQIKTASGVKKVKGEDFQSTGTGRDGIYQDYSEEYDDNGDLVNHHMIIAFQFPVLVVKNTKAKVPYCKRYQIHVLIRLFRLLH